MKVFFSRNAVLYSNDEEVLKEAEAYVRSNYGGVFRGSGITDSGWFEYDLMTDLSYLPSNEIVNLFKYMDELFSIEEG